MNKVILTFFGYTKNIDLELQCNLYLFMLIFIVKFLDLINNFMYLKKYWIKQILLLKTLMYLIIVNYF